MSSYTLLWDLEKFQTPICNPIETYMNFPWGFGKFWTCLSRITIGAQKNFGFPCVYPYWDMHLFREIVHKIELYLSFPQNRAVFVVSCRFLPPPPNSKLCSSGLNLWLVSSLKLITTKFMLTRFRKKMILNASSQWNEVIIIVRNKTSSEN